MGQCNTVMAFRKRLKSYGYTDIRIIKIKGHFNLYKIYAVEPLAKTCVSIEMDTVQMHNCFR